MTSASPTDPAALGRVGDGVAVVVLAGGAGRRFGRDKTQALLDGRTLLDHVLAGLAVGPPAQLPVVVVGPVHPTCRPVVWAREDPPLGGPVAALAAGLAVVPAGTTTVVALAADAPFAASAVPGLLAALAGTSTADAAVGVGPDARAQYLVAGYRVTALRAAIGADPAGTALRDVVARLVVVPVPLAERQACDVDTPDDLARLGSPA